MRCYRVCFKVTLALDLGMQANTWW